MRINLDSQALLDPRFKRLARALGIDWREALGRCVVLWMTCYDSRRAIVALTDADIIAELDGFAAALVAAGLAEQVDAEHVRVRGVADRIGFLERQRDRGRRGGRASGARRSAQANAQANAQAVACRPLKPSLAPDQDQDQEDPAPRAPRAPSRRELLARELAEVATGEINRLAGARYQADAEATLKACRALAKAGHTADDVRRVVSAKWGEWGDDPKMRDYFRPATLLGGKFPAYLEHVRATAGTSASTANGTRLRAPMPTGLLLPDDEPAADIGGSS